MTDYFDRLVSRALGQSPAVAPTRRSLFDAAPGASAESFGQAFEETRERETPGPPPAPTAESALRSEGSPMLEGGRLDAGRVTAQSGEPRAVEPTRSPAPAVEREGSDAAMEAPVSRVTPITAFEPELARPLPPAPRSPAPVSEVDGAAEVVPGRPVVRTRRADRRNQPVEPIEATGSVDGPGPRFAQSPVPLQGVRGAPSESAPAVETTETVIRVSIGRIEVRAAPPSAGAPARARPARPAPRMSLEAYLERSSGRRRR